MPIGNCVPHLAMEDGLSCKLQQKLMATNQRHHWMLNGKPQGTHIKFVGHTPTQDHAFSQKCTRGALMHPLGIGVRLLLAVMASDVALIVVGSKPGSESFQTHSVCQWFRFLLGISVAVGQRVLQIMHVRS